MGCLAVYLNMLMGRSHKAEGPLTLRTPGSSAWPPERPPPPAQGPCSPRGAWCFSLRSSCFPGSCDLSWLHQLLPKCPHTPIRCPVPLAHPRNAATLTLGLPRPSLVTVARDAVTPRLPVPTQECHAPREVWACSVGSRRLVACSGARHGGPSTCRKDVTLPGALPAPGAPPLEPGACWGCVRTSNCQAREGSWAECTHPGPGSVPGCAQARTWWASVSLEAGMPGPGGPLCLVLGAQTGWTGPISSVAEGAVDSHRRAWCRPGTWPTRAAVCGAMVLPP